MCRGGWVARTGRGYIRPSSHTQTFFPCRTGPIFGWGGLVRAGGGVPCLSTVGFLENARKERIASFDGVEMLEKATELPVLPFFHALLAIFWYLSKNPTVERGPLWGADRRRTNPVPSLDTYKRKSHKSFKRTISRIFK